MCQSWIEFRHWMVYVVYVHVVKVSPEVAPHWTTRAAYSLEYHKIPKLDVDWTFSCTEHVFRICWTPLIGSIVYSLRLHVVTGQVLSIALMYYIYLSVSFLQSYKAVTVQRTARKEKKMVNIISRRIARNNSAIDSHLPNQPTRNQWERLPHM